MRTGKISLPCRAHSCMQVSYASFLGYAAACAVWSCPCLESRVVSALAASSVFLAPLSLFPSLPCLPGGQGQGPGLAPAPAPRVRTKDTQLLPRGTLAIIPAHPPPPAPVQGRVIPTDGDRHRGLQGKDQPSTLQHPTHHEDLRGVRARASRRLVQRKAARAQAEHKAMRGVHHRGESAGADEEGHREVGGGRLPDLPASVAA